MTTAPTAGQTGAAPVPPPVRIARCTCGTAHRTWRKVSECALRTVVRHTAIPLRAGDGGPYALLGCKDRQVGARVRGTTVSLWPTYAAADAARRGMDSCGGFCSHDHEIIRLAGGQQETRPIQPVAPIERAPAERWLMEFLDSYGGGFWARQGFDAAKAAGHDEGAIRAAIKHLGVCVDQVNGTGPWFWMAPVRYPEEK